MIPDPATLAATHAAAFASGRAWQAAEFTSLLNSIGVILCGDAESFLLGRVIADEAEVLTLATHPDQQRKGLAHQRLMTFLGRAQDAGAARVFLEVAADNAPAKALYQKENFRVIAERPNYYTTQSGQKTAALVMERTFETSA